MIFFVGSDPTKNMKGKSSYSYDMAMIKVFVCIFLSVIETALWKYEPSAFQWWLVRGGL